MASTIMSKDAYASFYQKEPLVLNLKYEQGRTRTRLAGPHEVLTHHGGRYEPSPEDNNGGRLVKEHLMTQKIKVTEYLTKAREVQVDKFRNVMCEVVCQNSNISKMPTIRIGQHRGKDQMHNTS